MNKPSLSIPLASRIMKKDPKEWDTLNFLNNESTSTSPVSPHLGLTATISMRDPDSDPTLLSEKQHSCPTLSSPGPGQASASSSG